MELFNIIVNGGVAVLALKVAYQIRDEVHTLAEESKVATFTLGRLLEELTKRVERIEDKMMDQGESKGE